MGTTYYLVAVDDERAEEFMALFNTRVVDTAIGDNPRDGFIVEVGTERCPSCGGDERVSICIDCEVEFSRDL